MQFVGELKAGVWTPREPAAGATEVQFKQSRVLLPPETMVLYYSDHEEGEIRLAVFVPKGMFDHECTALAPFAAVTCSDDDIGSKFVPLPQSLVSLEDGAVELLDAALQLVRQWPTSDDFDEQVFYMDWGNKEQLRKQRDLLKPYSAAQLSQLATFCTQVLGAKQACAGLNKELKIRLDLQASTAADTLRLFNKPVPSDEEIVKRLRQVMAQYPELAGDDEMTDEVLLGCAPPHDPMDADIMEAMNEIWAHLLPSQPAQPGSAAAAADTAAETPAASG